MYIFYNCYFIVFSHFSLCSGTKLKLRDVAFEMQLSFDVWESQKRHLPPLMEDWRIHPTTQKIGLYTHVSWQFCPKNVDFVILMQFFCHCTFCHCPPLVDPICETLPPVTYLPSHFHLIHFIYQSLSIHLCTKVQLINLHLIHFTDHSPSHSNSPHLVLLMLHHISALLCLSFF